MQTLTDSIEINATPQEAFQWFMDIENGYRAWHPDHIAWRWISGEPFEVGSKAIIEERLHGEPHRFTCVTTRVKESERIEFSFTFPLSLIASGGSFEFAPAGAGCSFTANLSFRFGWLFSRIFRKEMNAVVKHMREEGENLKRILEAGCF